MKTFASTIEPLEARIAPATIIVTNNADSGMGSLRAALALADDVNHPGHDTIVFHLPTNELTSDDAFVIKLTSGALTSLGNVTVTGPGAGRLIIDGNGSVTHDRVLTVNDGHNSGITATDSPVTISGLSIIDGNVTGNGGGIYSTESLTLKNVVISGNTTKDSGGAVTVYDQAGTEGTKVVISNSLITGNHADAFVGGLNLANLKSISISKTIVTGNSCTYNGGGIYASVSSTGTGISITGCQVSYNSASFGGGVQVNDKNHASTSKTTISATTISNNTSTADKNASDMGAKGGGGLFVGGGNAVVTGSTISDNKAFYDGGGIEAINFTSLTISGSTISGNQTTNVNAQHQGGGGIFIEGNNAVVQQPVKITGSHITDNHSASYGGGIYAQVFGIVMTISSSTISGNHAVFDGGGIEFSSYSLTVNGGSFSDNGADAAGGGIDVAYGSFSITGSKVTGNIAPRGGGIDARTPYIVTVKDVVATGNFAQRGGGMNIASAEFFHVSGGSFTGNSASISGGGIYVAGCTGSILGVTISGNAATNEGGGVFETGSDNDITLQIAKVTANTAPTGPDIFGVFTPFP